MKKFWQFFALFLVLLFVVDRSAAWLLDSLYTRIKTGDRGSGLLNTYLAHADQRPLLIMGNSRTGVNVCPDSLGPEAFSVAYNGTTQLHQTGVLSVLQYKQKLPATILLHVDLDEYVEPSQPEDIQALRYYYGRVPLITSYFNELSWLEPLKHVFAMYRHNGHIPLMALNYLHQRHATGLNQGYYPAEPSPRDSARTLYSWARLAESHPTLNRDHLRYLEDFIGICQREGVQLICFTSTYYQKPPYLAATSALLDSTLRAHRVPYLNYAQQPIEKIADNVRFWRDATHLNTRGVPLQSQRLAQDVTLLLRAQQNPEPQVMTADNDCNEPAPIKPALLVL